MKKILKSLVALIWLICYLQWYAENLEINLSSNTNISWLTNINDYDNNSEINQSENSENNIKLEDELKKDWITLNSANDKNTNIVDLANDLKNKEINKLFWKTEEEKNINTIENVLASLEIKKDLASNQLEEIENSLKLLQKNIEDNNKTITSLRESKNITEVKNELQKLEEINEELKKDLERKENLIFDLNSDLKKYVSSEEKYQLLMSDYIEAKKERDTKIWNEKIKKLYYLLSFLSIFLIIYVIKNILIKNEKFIKSRPNFWEYFDLLYWISLVIFLVIYVFYLFPELYALVILISSALILINAQVISSFVASLILFRHFKIWDIIKIWTEKWKIIKMNPLSTIVRKINEYWVIENEEVNIPNIDLLKEKVTLAKNSQNKENVFNIILSLNWKKDIFEIVDNIRENIFSKMLDKKLTTLNPDNNDTFKTKYEHIDQDKIKITFYWIWNSELNRKIEKRIIQYIKNYIYFDEWEKNKTKKQTSTKKTSDWNVQKIAIIQEQMTT